MSAHFTQWCSSCPCYHGHGQCHTVTVQTSFTVVTPNPEWSPYVDGQKKALEPWEPYVDGDWRG